jgi:hypothetical protein
MGLNRKYGPINGTLRMTYYSAEHGSKARNKGLAPLTDNEEDLYKTNIQIAELNALNACLSVIKFKQLRGFYCEEIPHYHLLFEVQDFKTVSETELD